MQTVIGPAGELHGAALLVEREVLYIDGARRLEDGAAQPRYVAIVGDDDVGAQERRVVLGVGTARVKQTNNHQKQLRLLISAEKLPTLTRTGCHIKLTCYTELCPTSTLFRPGCGRRESRQSRTCSKQDCNRTTSE